MAATPEPPQGTPTTAGKQMSSKLRERLKRCGRYHCSPYARKEKPTVSPMCSTIPRGDNPDLNTTCDTSTPYRNKTATTESQLKAGKRLFNPSPDTDSVENSDILCQSLSSPKSRTEQVKLIQVSELEDNDKLSLVGEPEPAVIKKNSTPKPQWTVPSCVKDKSQPQTVQDLHRIIQEKKEILRKLKMVKMYRKKNNLCELELLISKWRRVSQEALQDLHSRLPEPKPSLTDLVNHLQIEHNLIGFLQEEETFE